MGRRDRKPIQLHELLSGAARQLRAEFDACQLVPHSGVKGQELEIALKTFLNQHLPGRFRAVSGFILANNGEVSGHQDVIIYDALHAPTYRYSENAAIVPNDAVAAVVEVKSRITSTTLVQAVNKANEVKRLPKTRQGMSLTMDDRGCLTEASEVEADGMVLTKVFLFGYETDLTPQKAVEVWHEHYHRVPLGNQIDTIVMLDRAVLTHFYACARLAEPTGMLHPDVGALGWETFMGSTERDVILGFPAIDIDRESGEFRYQIMRGKQGIAPGDSVWLGLTELGQESLDFFFRSLLRYLQMFRRVMVTPDGPRRSDQTGVRSQAIPLCFALDPAAVDEADEGEALFQAWSTAWKEIRERGLTKYVDGA